MVELYLQLFGGGGSKSGAHPRESGQQAAGESGQATGERSRTVDGYKASISNPAGIPDNAMTQNEFLAINGMESASSGWVIDKLRGNRQLRTQRGRERFERERAAAEEEYQNARNAAKEKYQQLVNSGVLRDKTPVEKRLTVAHGNPDNASTQAARRLLEKQGIDWRTGKKL